MFPTRAMTILGGDSFRDEYSLAFDGTDDNIRIPEIEYSVHDADFSFVFWCKRNATGVVHTVLGSTATNGSRHIRFESNDKLQIESDTGGDNATGTLIVTDTNWHHYAVIVSSGTVTMYQNGIVCSVANNVGDNNLTINTIAGQGTNGTVNEFDGNISEIAVYNIALSSSQAKQIYNGREPFDHKNWSKAGNLTQWWRMGDGRYDKYFTSNGLINDEASPTLGAQLHSSFTNADFDSHSVDGTGFTAANTTPSSNENNQSAISCTAGKIYKVFYNATINSGATPKVEVSTNTGLSGTDAYSQSITTGGTEFVFQASASTMYLGFRSPTAAATNFTVADSVTVQEVGGNAGEVVNMDASDFVGETP